MATSFFGKVPYQEGLRRITSSEDLKPQTQKDLEGRLVEVNTELRMLNPQHHLVNLIYVTKLGVGFAQGFFERYRNQTMLKAVDSYIRDLQNEINSLQK